MNPENREELSNEDISDAAFQEILGGGLENEVAAIGGFTATMFLQVAKRQIALIKSLEATVPGFIDTFQAACESPDTLVQAASMLGSVLEDCVDEETPEDSMLHQVLDHCAALVEQK